MVWYRTLRTKGIHMVWYRTSRIKGIHMVWYRTSRIKGIHMVWYRTSRIKGIHLVGLNGRALPVVEIILKEAVPNTKLELFQKLLILHQIKSIEDIKTRLSTNP